MPRGQGLFMVVLQRVGLTFNTSLGYRRGPLIKFLQNFPRVGMIGYLTLSLKREELLSHQTRRPLVENVARRIMVIASLG